MLRLPPLVMRADAPVSDRQRKTSNCEFVPSPPVWPQNQKSTTSPATAKANSTLPT